MLLSNYYTSALPLFTYFYYTNNTPAFDGHVCQHPPLMALARGKQFPEEDPLPDCPNCYNSQPTFAPFSFLSHRQTVIPRTMNPPPSFTTNT